MSSTPPSELTQALALLRPYQRKALAWSLVTALLSLAPALYMFQVYDRVVNSRNLTTLAMLTLLVVGVYAVQVLLDGVRHALLQRASHRLDQLLGLRVFDALFTLQASAAGPAAEQAQADLRTLRDFLVSPAALAFLALPGALLFLLCIAWISPLLGGAALLGALLQLALAAWTQARTQPPLLEAGRAAMSATAYAQGALQRVQVIESMGMLQGVHQRWIARHRQFLAWQARASDAAGLTSTLSRTVQVIQGSALLGLGCWLYLRDRMPEGAGMVIVVSLLGGKALQPLVKAVGQWKLVVQARQARERLAQFLAQVPPRAEQMPLPPPSGRLQVEGLTVPAPDPATQPPLLRNISLQLKAGTVLAVVGASGAGKTTLARALLGLLPSAGGQVRLDGIDLRTRDKELLGPHLGYLPQEVALFEGTLAENVARFGEPDPAALQAACALAGLDTLLAQWPAGVDTPLGPDGAFLSGGQRQRVGLARALYGRPALVVLDEPYAHMDDEGEAVVLQAVRALKARGCTVILVTHLQSMLAVADGLLVLHKGSVKHLGARDEVVAQLEKARAARPAPPAARLSSQEAA